MQTVVVCITRLCFQTLQSIITALKSDICNSALKHKVAMYKVEGLCLTYQVSIDIPFLVHMNMYEQNDKS